MLLGKRSEKKKSGKRQEEGRWRELEFGGLWQDGTWRDLGIWLWGIKL